MGKRILIDRSTLVDLYVNKKWSPSKIAKIYNCDRQTIANRLTEENILKRSRSESLMRYPKNNFSENLSEKAYLIGFRLGDLNIYKKAASSGLIVARCHTTHLKQAELMKNIFSKYGHVTVSSGDNGYTINCYLNLTFNFLLPKSDHVPNWIKTKGLIVSFISGYIDAEGSFILNQKRARFKLESYDKNILHWISVHLHKLGIENKFHQMGNQGDIRSFKYPYPINKDVWRVEVNKAQSILKLVEKIGPFLKHRGRIEDMFICKKNVLLRIERGTVKYEKQ